jgi:hypothetical protein
LEGGYKAAVLCNILLLKKMLASEKNVNVVVKRLRIANTYVYGFQVKKEKNKTMNLLYRNLQC